MKIFNLCYLPVVLLLSSCNKHLSPEELRVKDYTGTFILDSIAWQGERDIDLNGDGLCSSDLLSEFESMPNWSNYRNDVKAVCTPNPYSATNTVLFRMPIQNGYLEDGKADWLECGLGYTDMSFSFNNEGFAVFDISASFNYLTAGSISTYQCSGVNFHNGTAKYETSARFYDAATCDFISGTAVFTYKRIESDSDSGNDN